MRIKVATTRYFVNKFVAQIASATSIQDLEDIEKELDKRLRQGVFDINYWYSLDLVWFARKRELMK